MAWQELQSFLGRLMKLLPNLRLCQLKNCSNKPVNIPTVISPDLARLGPKAMIMKKFMWQNRYTL
ncbi:hypothetical protein A210_27105 [Pseudomonas putida SJTE-1]|nr:hypothetical protein A210_27105 [Pseudomonas putida SJTE-1]